MVVPGRSGGMHPESRRVRPEGPSTKCGQAAKAVGCLGRALESKKPGGTSYASCCWETNPCESQGSCGGSALQGMPACLELGTSRTCLPLSLNPRRAESGLWESPSQGEPCLQAGLWGTKSLSITHSWEAASQGVPRAQVGWGKVRRGWSLSLGNP